MGLEKRAIFNRAVNISLSIYFVYLSGKNCTVGFAPSVGLSATRKTLPAPVTLPEEEEGQDGGAATTTTWWRRWLLRQTPIEGERESPC